MQVKCKKDPLSMEDRCYLSSINHSIHSPLEQLSLWIRFTYQYNLSYKIACQRSNGRGGIDLTIKPNLAHGEWPEDKFFQGVRLLSSIRLIADSPTIVCTTNEVMPDFELTNQQSLLNNQSTAVRIMETFVRQACEEQLGVTENRESDLAFQVSSAIYRHLLLHGFGSTPRMEWVAAQLGISKRTLQRELRMIGTSYANRLEHILKFSILEKLSESCKSIDTVSKELGYDNSSNFSRSCKRHFKATPKSIKNRLEQDIVPTKSNE